MTGSLLDALTPDRWTIRELALRRLASSPNEPFVTEVDGRTESYGQFAERASALAHFYAECGVAVGHMVAVLCHNGIPALHGWMAASLIGAVDVTVNSAYRGELLAHVLRTTQPKVALVDARLVDGLLEVRDQLPFLTHVVIIGAGEVPADDYGFQISRYEEVVETRVPMPAREIEPQDPAAVMFTSGTTGPSKAVLLPNAQVCLLAHQVIVNMRLSADDVYYNAHPLHHIAGKFMGVLAVFTAGGHLMLDRKFDAEAWLATIRRVGATVGIAHGPMIEMIHATAPTSDDRNHQLRRLMCCPLPKSIGRAFEQRFGLRGIEMWGMTEVTCPCWTSLDSEHPLGSCGKPMDEWFDVRIVNPETDRELQPGETGEIVVRPRSPWTTFAGYLGAPEATVEAWRNLWFHTGDAGWRDNDGYFFILDRIKDRIRRRAENISSYEIEAAALQLTAIREAAAVGVPSGMEGDDDIKLCVALDRPVEPADILMFLAARLPHFMVPRYIEIMPLLPRTPTNKLKKRELRDGGVGPHTWDRHRAGIRLKQLIEERSAKKTKGENGD